MTKMRKKLSTTIFFVLSFLCILFNEPRFFSTEFQFIVYCIPIIYGLSYIITSMQSKTLGLATILPFWIITAFYSLTLIILVIHRDIMWVGLGHIFYFVLIFICFCERKNITIEDELLLLMKMLSVLAIVVSLLSIIIVPFIKSHPDSYAKMDENSIRALSVIGRESYRYVGILGHPNKTGNFCALCIIGSELVYFIDKQIKWKCISIVSILFSAFTILLTGSRTSMLMVSVFSALFFLLLLILGVCKNKSTRKAFVLFIVIMFFFALIFLAYLFIQGKFNHFLDNVVRTDSIKSSGGRNHIWTKAIELSRGHRLIGVGQIELSDKINVDAHNTYLQILTTDGVPCFILFLIFLISAIYAAVKNVIAEVKERNEIKNLIIAIFFLCAIVAIMIENIWERQMFCLFFTPGVFGYYIISTTIKLWDEKKKL